MNAVEIGKSLLIGRCFTQKSFNESKKKIDSKEVDFIAQGYEPSQGAVNGKAGILYSWIDTPLAFWDIPTLNRMVFSKVLWNSLLANPYIKASLDSKSMWGEAFHADSDEILIPNVALRVNNFKCVDNNLVVGDIDLMDTPNGLICYSLAKTGKIGNSSRGYGNLQRRADGLSDVVQSDYQHVSWDAVTFPAVPDCTMTIAQEAAMASKDVSNGMSDLTLQLRHMVGQALERNPKNNLLMEMYSILMGKYEDDGKKAHKANLFSKKDVLHMVSVSEKRC